MKTKIILLFLLVPTLLQAQVYQTKLIRNFNTEVVTGLNQFVSGLYSDGTKTYFYVSNQNNSNSLNESDLWITDGSETGTKKVKDFKSVSLGLSLNGITYFSAVEQGESNTSRTTLWKTDGTPNGTISMRGTESIRYPKNLTILDTQVYFNGEPTTNSTFKNFLCRTDGTDASTIILRRYGNTEKPVPHTPSRLVPHKGKLYFFADSTIANGNSNIRGFYESNGTVTGTKVLVNNSFGSSLNNFGDNLILNFNSRLSITDGVKIPSTISTAVALVDDYDGNQPVTQSSGVVLNGFYYFWGETERGKPTMDVELWRTDGTVGGTTLVKNINPNGLGNPNGIQNWDENFFVLLGNQFIFSANDGTNGVELWRSDGTASGTVLIKDLATGTNHVFRGKPDKYFVYKNRLYFSTGGKLYYTDGTSAGTKQITLDVIPGDFSIIGNTMTVISSPSNNRHELRTISMSVFEVDCNNIQVAVTQKCSELKATVTGGTPPFTYQWRNSANEPIGTNADTYHLSSTEFTRRISLVITDSKGCSATSPQTQYLAPLTNLVTDVSGSGTVSLCAGDSTSAFFSIINLGGIASDKTLYQVKRDNVIVFKSKNRTFYVSKGGTYSGELVNEADNCAYQAGNKINVSELPALAKPVITASSLSITQGGSVTLSIPEVQGLIYEWYSEGMVVGSKSTYIATKPGTYQVIVRYSGGKCPVSESINIRLQVCTPPTLTAISSKANKLCPGETAELSITATGGTAPYTYQWKNGIAKVGTNAATFTATEAGNYSVEVTDAKSCVAASNTFAISAGKFETTISGGNALCSGSNLTLTANASCGTAPYTYQWKNGIANVGNNANTLSVNAPGVYSVVVTDAKGVVAASGSITVTQKSVPATPTVSASATGFVTGERVTLTATVGTGLSIQWLRDGAVIAGVTQSTYTTSEAGSYSVRVSNTDGCSATSSAVVLSVILANIPQNKGQGLQIAPNPVGNQAKITLHLAQPASARVYITDATGKRLRAWESTNKTVHHEVVLEMRSVVAGSYVVQAEAEGQVFLQKLVKE